MKGSAMVNEETDQKGFRLEEATIADMHEAIRACSEEARTDMGEKFQKNEAFLASIFPG